MGVPSIATILSENQKKAIYILGKIGFVLNIGLHNRIKISKLLLQIKLLLSNWKERKAMAETGQNLINSNGFLILISTIKGSYE